MTHVVSFLILHEITAVVPLVGLAGLFHWMGWIPDVSALSMFIGELELGREKWVKGREWSADHMCAQ